MCGRIYSYIHHNNKIGVMLQVLCDTDFTAKTKQFEELCENIALHIVATSPQCISTGQFITKYGEYIQKQRQILKNKLLLQKKPENMIETIANNMIDKKVKEKCLLSQKFFNDQKKQISDLIRDLSNKTNENILISRFQRFQLGK